MSAGRKASPAFALLLFILFLLAILFVHTFAIIILFFSRGIQSDGQLFLRTLSRCVISCTSLAKCEIFSNRHVFLRPHFAHCVRPPLLRIYPISECADEFYHTSVRQDSRCSVWTDGRTRTG